MRRCSEPCLCPPDAPAVGLPSYMERRAHPDAGDLEAIRLITGWIRSGGPVMYLRFADGEFYSMMGNGGKNADGMPFYSETLGVELRRVLREIQAGALINQKALIGGDWSLPEASAWLKKKDLLQRIPWGPVSIWVSGIKSGETAKFFEALLADPRPRIFVGNERLQLAATFLKGTFIPVPAAAAWTARAKVAAALEAAPKDAVVLYCAGMATEAFAWSAHKKRPDLSHLDMGHIFDGAIGNRSRSWLQETGDCSRRDVYFSQYVPVMRGERTSFGEFPVDP